MFRRLHVKLAVLYAALFGVILLGVAAVVFQAVASNAQRQVRDELAAGGAVYDRVWSLRSEQMREGATLLSRDFGFREAVASQDQATIVSALDNLRERFSIDLALMVTADGRVVAGSAQQLQSDAPALIEAFADADDPSGVMVVGGAPYQLISAPVLSPDLKGWVVFGARLDAREMRALERLSSIPLEATVLHATPRGWRGEAAADPRLGAFIGQALAAKTAEPRTLATPHGPAIALVKPLPTLTARDHAVLVLKYPLARALAPYRPLLAALAAAGLLGLALVVLGSWALARGVTRPVAGLDAAVRRLSAGEDAQAPVTTKDEIGRLAESFNRMATEIRERERRIIHQALHDAETGLPNRRALERALAAAPEGGFVVGALGVDRFDHVRGAIGYGFAAEAIRTIGERLAELAPGCEVARLSTDVLGFSLGATDLADAEVRAARLLSQLEQPIRVGGETLDVLLSLGLAPVGEQGRAAALEQATIALDQARAGRRKIAAFDPAAYGDPASNLSLMSEMLDALAKGHMELFHQPKYGVAQGAITAVEALARWRHPVRGLMAPDLFIPMAEETGHIRALTDWAVRQAIQDQRRLLQAGHRLEVAVNISGRVLGDADFVAFAADAVAGAAGPVCFEITETAVIENPEAALANLDRFAEAGISISIDDFGSGLSSLAYLKRIRGHELKIDKSIVAGVADSQRDALIVRSTIDLAHSLGLKVTAEGVEDETAYALLAGMGCDSIQGYLIARPQPLDQLLETLSEGAMARRSHG